MIVPQRPCAIGNDATERSRDLSVKCISPPGSPPHAASPIRIPGVFHRARHFSTAFPLIVALWGGPRNVHRLSGCATRQGQVPVGGALQSTEKTAETYVRRPPPTASSICTSLVRLVENALRHAARDWNGITDT